MDELIALVVKKTGLSEDMAKVAVDTVIDFIKDQLPDSIAGRLDSILSGDNAMDTLTKGLGGFLGGK